MADNIGREMGWEEEISNDSSFELVPDGDYDFKVTGFERGRSKGQGKLPACNMATLSVDVTNGVNKTNIKHYLVLHTSLEWRLCEFFRAIGARKSGEKVAMNWGMVIGATGRCKVVVEQYRKNDGTTGESNKIDKFYDRDEAPVQPGGWKPGAF